MTQWTVKRITYLNHRWVIARQRACRAIDYCGLTNRGLGNTYLMHRWLIARQRVCGAIDYSVVTNRCLGNTYLMHRWLIARQRACRANSCYHCVITNWYNCGAWGEGITKRLRLLLCLGKTCLLNLADLCLAYCNYRRANLIMTCWRTVHSRITR